MCRRPILFKVLALIAVPFLLFGITIFIHQGPVGTAGGRMYLEMHSASPINNVIAGNLKYASVDHCPYYPPHISHIPFILSESTLLECQDAEKRFHKGKPIVLVIANSKHFYLLANWLCVSAGSINTQNLLVVVPPEESDFVQILLGKGINAIQANYRKECFQRNKNQMDPFHRALLVRNLVIMLLTAWGHDVAVFDPDAFILQDPIEMYQNIIQESHAHVVGQQGSMPNKLKKLWGFTLCAGAMYYHSSTPLNVLWQEIADLHSQTGPHVGTDDQQLLNNALRKLGIQWKRTTSEQNIQFSSHIGTAGNLTVVAVAANYSVRASQSEFQALDPKKLRIMHAKLGKYGKDNAIRKFDNSLWKLSIADFRKTTRLTSSSKKTTELETWLKQICLQQVT